MTALSNAIAELSLEVAAFHQGTKVQPKDRSTEWFLLRAKTLGLAYLQRIETLGVEADPAACERVYKKGSLHLKAANVPPPPVVEREELPDRSESQAVA